MEEEEEGARERVVVDGINVGSAVGAPGMYVGCAVGLYRTEGGMCVGSGVGLPGKYVGLSVGVLVG